MHRGLAGVGGNSSRTFGSTFVFPESRPRNTKVFRFPCDFPSLQSSSEVDREDLGGGSCSVRCCRGSSQACPALTWCIVLARGLLASLGSCPSVRFPGLSRALRMEGQLVRKRCTCPWRRRPKVDRSRPHLVGGLGSCQCQSSSPNSGRPFGRAGDGVRIAVHGVDEVGNFVGQA